MRLQSPKKINMKGRVIGGPSVAVCVPLTAGDKAGLMTEAGEVVQLGPDLVEWRADACEALHDKARHLEILEALCRVISPIPLIYTLRIKAEGGIQEMAQSNRKDLIVSSIQTGLPDLVDIELCNDPSFISEIIQAARAHDVKVILSFHDFEKTPERKVILDRLTRAAEMGADIAKAAVMPENPEDLLALLSVTLEARRRLDIPLITISMAEMGVLSRSAGGIFGSDITFASGTTASAPGQVPAAQLRQAMSAFGLKSPSPPDI